MARWVFQPLPLLREMERRYGPTVLIPGRPPMLWLGDPDAVRDLFAGDPEVLHAGEANAVLEGVLGRWSMFLLDGEAHRRERKLIMPALHGERMRAYTEAMRRAAREATRRWRPGERFSFLAEMQAVTLDVMARTVFGVGDASATWRLRDLLRALVPRVQEPGLFLAASVFGSARVRRWIDAGARPHRLPGGVTFDPSPLLPGGRMVSLLREIEALLYAEFAERRRRGDTAARTDVLSWAMHHLLAHPEALHRLEAEVRAALARADASDAIADLAYLDAVIKESMRLTPIVPVIQRLTRAPVRLGRHEVPAGVLVMAQVYTIHHRADLYPEPDRFRPERFLARRYAPHEHFPFGGGVRRCVGAAFATHSMKMVLAEVVAGAKLERVGPEARLERRGVLFAPSGGLVVRRVRASPR
jgi:cytochrome P450